MDAQVLEDLRRYLFCIAYRMLGSASDAEDVVQEAYLRFQLAPDLDVRSPKAYLATIVTRLCLDQLKSARITRETYLGPWLPEPVLTADLDPTPEERVERADDVSFAFLLLLEELSPEERVTYVLREAFDFPYDEIAATLGKSVGATRQLAHRARERVASGDRRYEAEPLAQRRLAERFLAAARQGDMRVLMDALAGDVVAWADGGAEAHAARRPICNADRVARLMIGFFNKIFADTSVTLASLNGGFGLLYWRDNRLVNVTLIADDGCRVRALYSVPNPSKLDYLRKRLTAPAPP